MNAAVLVEKLGEKKCRASTSQPIPLETEGRTRDEAVKRLCALAQKRLAAGQWQQVSLPGPPQINPGSLMPEFGRTILTTFWTTLLTIVARPMGRILPHERLCAGYRYDNVASVSKASVNACVRLRKSNFAFSGE